MILLKKGLRLLLLAVFILGLEVNDAKAQFNFSFPLTSTTKSNELILGGSAKLTANGTTDPIDKGWLRLTSDSRDQKGWAYIDQAFPSTLGLLVEFEYKIWSAGEGSTMGLADGLSVFLYDGATEQIDFNPGHHGGALIYANGPSADDEGLSNGYLGIGLDEYGNFSVTSGGKIGGMPALVPNSIALRGGANGGYSYISGTGPNLSKSLSAKDVDAKLANVSIGYIPKSSARPVDDQFYRKVRFYLLPTTDGTDFQISVELQKDTGGPFYTVIKNQRMGVRPPSLLKVGFGASTGDGWANHEVRHLIVSTPVDLAVKTTVDKTSARITSTSNVNNDNKVAYTTVISNPGINAIVGADIIELAIETDGVNIPADVSIGALKSSNATSIVKNEVRSTSNKQVYEITNFPVGGSLTLTYHGTIEKNISFVATNKAAITLAPKFIDVNSAHNMSAVSTTILRDVDLKLTNAVDVSNPQPVGAKLNYTTSVSNWGEGIINPLSTTLLIELNGVDIDVNSIHWVYNTIASNGNILITKNEAQSSLNKYVYNIANFPSNGAITFTYNGIIKPGSSSVTNKATIAPPLNGFYELDNSNNQSVVTTMLIKDVDLQVKVSRAVPSEVRKGGVVNYTAVISNKGIYSIDGAVNIATLSITTSGVTIRPQEIVTNAINSQGIKITHNTNRSTADTQVYDISNFPAEGSLTLNYRGIITSESLPAINFIEIGAPADFRDINMENNAITATSTIIKLLNLAITTTVDKTTEVVGSRLRYTTVMANLGPNAVTDATLSIEKIGIKITPDQFLVSTTYGKSDGLIHLESSTSSKQVYHITDFPVGGIITLTNEGTILPGSHSVVNKSIIAPPISGYYEVDNQNNISVAQTFIKPILSQPLSMTICPSELINQTLVSDNPSLISYTWTAEPSTSAIRVRESRTSGHIIQGAIKNTKITGGTVVYTIIPTIKAPIMPSNGAASSAFTNTVGDVKTFTVIIKSRAEAPSVSVAKRNIHYLEDAVFTPSSSLPSATYHWYASMDKHDPIKNGLIDHHDGVLTMSKLLPGIHTFYVTVSNADFCESAVTPIMVTVKSIPIVKPTNTFTPNHDGINDFWHISHIEQYPHCTVLVFGRHKGEEAVYEAPNGYREPWNGTDKHGKPLTGTYWYKIDLKDGSAPIFGHVAIIR